MRSNETSHMLPYFVKVGQELTFVNIIYQFRSYSMPKILEIQEVMLAIVEGLKAIQQLGKAACLQLDMVHNSGTEIHT